MATLTQEQVSSILDKNKVSDTDTNVSLNEIDSFGDKKSILEMFDNIKQYNAMLREKITFVNDQLTKVIPFTRENLYLICAYTGSGKTSMAANISYPLWQQGKKSLIIANEEGKSDILFRIACLHLGYNFNSFKKGNMSADKQKDCVKLFPEISKYIKILDVTYKDGLTTTLEGVINALEAVKRADFSCCMIDYFSLISRSVKDSSRSRYDVLNELRTYMQRYIKTSNIPIVLFAQLHSLGKRNNADLDSRVKECPTILEAATVVLEIIPDFENQKTSILIKKDRFGLSGKKVEVGFDNGRFVPYDDAFRTKIKQYKIDTIHQNNVDLGATYDNPYIQHIEQTHVKFDEGIKG